MVLAASGATECTLHGVPLNGPVMECLKGLNQVGARLRWEEDGRILCQGGEPVSGYNKSILDKVVHVGDDPFNLHLMLFQMVTRPARLKIIGESGLKFVDLAPIRHFLPLLGARLTSVVPGQEGLPARLESSAPLPGPSLPSGWLRSPRKRAPTPSVTAAPARVTTRSGSSWASSASLLR